MSGQPYSDKARDAWMYAHRYGETESASVVAMHDREALGLDASVCARTYRAELAEEIVVAVKRYAVWPAEKNAVGWLESILHREFGDQP